MPFLERLLWLMVLNNFHALGDTSLNVTFIEENVSCTIINLSNESNTGNYSILSNKTEELIFKKASLDTLDLTEALNKIAPWKVLISDSNVTRVVFPAQMTPSVVHLRNMIIHDLIFEENYSVQDFRADYTTLQTVTPTVTQLFALDILWVTHSELTNFSFNILENSSISLLYLVANRIETVSISTGLVCCKNLEEIFLSDNRLKQLDFGTIAMMQKLKTIFLEGNQLVEVSMSIDSTNVSYDEAKESNESNETTVSFCSWRSYYLKKMQNLSGVENATPNCTDYFATLLSIHLARNQLVQVNFTIFSLMNSLNSLDISNNMLLHLISSENQVPVRLSELFISNNNITEVYLTPFPSLKALYLYDNNLKVLNMSSLPKDIDYLNLINNPLDCNELSHMNRSTNFPEIGPYTEC